MNAPVRSSPCRDRESESAERAGGGKETNNAVTCTRPSTAYAVPASATRGRLQLLATGLHHTRKGGRGYATTASFGAAGQHAENDSATRSARTGTVIHDARRRAGQEAEEDGWMDRGKTFSHQVPYQLAGNDGMGALTGRHGRSSSGARPLARSSQSRSRSRIRYCRPVPVRRGLRRAAQPGTPRTGECICTRQQRHTRWGKACPSSPPPPPRETHAHALQTDGSGGNDDSREDMHGETQTHAEMGWACSLPLPERAAQARRLQLHGTAQRNPTAPMLNYSTHDTVPVRGLYRTVHAHTDAWLSPRTREKTLQPTASLLHASAFSLELESSLFTLPYWMESTGPATASQVNNSQVTVGVSGSYPPPCAALDLPAAACLVP